jgi:hypothetical protein
MINNYRENYYKMSNFDSTLKAMASYKLDELIDLCKKLDIQLPSENNNNICNSSSTKNKNKFLKKDIYQLLVSNY